MNLASFLIRRVHMYLQGLRGTHWVDKTTVSVGGENIEKLTSNIGVIVMIKSVYFTGMT